MTEQDAGGGAERAFEALRAEVGQLREALEANRPADTTETLGKIAKDLEWVGNQLTAIEAHPAMRLSPQQYQNAIAAAGEGAVRNAVQMLERAAADAKKEQQQLAGLIASVRGRRKQLEWLGWTAAAALLLGLILFPVAARWLPFGWDGQVAAFIMKTDRWKAGSALMQAQSPQAFADLEAAAGLLKLNKVALEACQEAAAKTKKEQRCTVVVSAP